MWTQNQSTTHSLARSLSLSFSNVRSKPKGTKHINKKLISITSNRSATTLTWKWAAKFFWLFTPLCWPGFGLRCGRQTLTTHRHLWSLLSMLSSASTPLRLPLYVLANSIHPSRPSVRPNPLEVYFCKQSRGARTVSLTTLLRRLRGTCHTLFAELISILLFYTLRCRKLGKGKGTI